MKLISTEGGQALQLIIMDEVRPLSGFYLPTLYTAMVERYRFITFPANWAADVANGAKFHSGHHVADGRDIAITEIGVYNDGVVVIALNTSDADVIMDDFISWATRTFKLRERQTKKPRTYASSVVIEFAASIDDALRNFEAISQNVTDAINNAYGLRAKINFFRLALAADPQTVPALFNTQLLIERRVGVPFAQNRYYSAAPLTTDAHLTLLEKIEGSLAN